MRGLAQTADWLAEVKLRVQILEVAQRYTKLRPAGASWRGACPIHRGSGANFAVFPARGSFQCFVCGEHGDAFTLLMKIDGVSFIDAAKRLAQDLGVPVPERGAPRSAAAQARLAHRDFLRTTVLPADPTPQWDAWLAPVGGIRGVQAQGAVVTPGTATEGPAVILPLGDRPDAPLGWWRYPLTAAIADARPTLDPASDPAAAQGWFVPPHARERVYRTVLTVAPTPWQALMARARGIEAVLAPAGGLESVPWVSVDHVARLAPWRLSRVVCTGPAGGALRARWLRALHEAEGPWVAAGVEPLWLDGAPHEAPEAFWAHIASTPTTWAATLQTGTGLRDVFESRVDATARAWRARQLPLAEALAKVASTLWAAQRSGDRALFHAYLTWTVRAFALRDRSALLHAMEHLESQVVHPVPPTAETF